MARSNRYKCNISNFAFPMMKNGKQRWLRFLGSKADEGYYTTQDEAEQEAIESSKRYKRGEIVKISSYEIADGIVDESTIAEPTAIIEVVSGVTTVQAAREWLISHREAKSNDLPNKEAVLSYASLHGVKFEDLS